jgi:Zn-dependent membrane protease YugP
VGAAGVSSGRAAVPHPDARRHASRAAIHNQPATVSAMIMIIIGLLSAVLVFVAFSPALLFGGVVLGLTALYWLGPIAAAIAVVWIVRDAWKTHRAYRD